MVNVPSSHCCAWYAGFQQHSRNCLDWGHVNACVESGTCEALDESKYCIERSETQREDTPKLDPAANVGVPLQLFEHWTTAEPNIEMNFTWLCPLQSKFIHWKSYVSRRDATLLVYLNIHSWTERAHMTVLHVQIASDPLQSWFEAGSATIAYRPEMFKVSMFMCGSLMLLFPSCLYLPENLKLLKRFWVDGRYRR